MTDEERNSFENLVLLCIVHHEVVDKIRPKEFSIADLEAWKDNRVTSGRRGSSAAIASSARPDRNRIRARNARAAAVTLLRFAYPRLLI